MRLFRNIFVISMVVLFASCRKENVIERPDNPSVGLRTVSVSVTPSTKTSLDGLQWSFVAGDRILVSNGTDAPETCTVRVNGDNMTFSTTLEGTLTAVYPANAAKMDSDNSNMIVGVLVPAVQDGTFAKANICMAEEIQTSAVFSNKTAIFKITPPSEEEAFTITSLKTVSDGARTGTAVAINTDGEGDEKNVITVSNNELDTFYVSLLPGVKLSDLSFEYTTDDTHGAMKGISQGTLTSANRLYQVSEQNWHPYVRIGGKKWATDNAGATADNRFGDPYSFDWGGPWRTPTTGSIDSDSDFINLMSECKNEYNTDLDNNTHTRIKLIPTDGVPTGQGIYLYKESGNEAVIFIDANGNRLSFPYDYDEDDLDRGGQSWTSYFANSESGNPDSVCLGIEAGTWPDDPVYFANFSNLSRVGECGLRPISD